MSKKKTKNKDNKVKITQKLIHYLPCSVSQIREGKWDITRHYDWGKVRSYAIETININDLFVLIAIVKAFQDLIAFTEEGEIMKDKPTIRLTIGFWSFINQYLGTHDAEQVSKNLQRLISWKVIFMQKNGEQNPQSYLIDYKIYEVGGVKKATFVLNKNFYDACVNRGLLINFDALKKIKSNLTRALFIYLEGTTAKSLYQHTLEKVLGLDTTNMASWDKRDKIKKAFDDLKSHFLIQDYQCEKKEKDFLFTYW